MKENNRLNMIVTAGGTSEKIDDVRTITNNSTGRLGAAIAEELVQISQRDYSKGAMQIGRLFYVCGKNAVLPQTEVAEVCRVGGVDDLAKTLKELLHEHEIDGVIHSMAVSDYGVQAAFGAGQMREIVLDCLRSCKCQSEEEMAETLMKAIFSEEAGQNRENKISSDLDHLAILMKKTPKVVGLIKEWSPGTLLVGFKLLSNAAPQVLIDTAYRLMKKNDCVLVLANDLSTISSGVHTGYLIQRDGSFQELQSKEAIARELATQVLEMAAERKSHGAERTGN